MNFNNDEVDLSSDDSDGLDERFWMITHDL